ncbi:MAG TPA: hypothetical protein VGM27_05595 [Acidobacteriaceae bacterium]
MLTRIAQSSHPEGTVRTVPVPGPSTPKYNPLRVNNFLAKFVLQSRGGLPRPRSSTISQALTSSAGKIEARHREYFCGAGSWST